MKNKIYKLLFSTASILLSMYSYGSPTIVQGETKSTALGTDFMLAIIAAILVIPIYLIAKTFLYAAKMNAEKDERKKTNIKSLLIIAFCLIGFQSMAQDAAVAHQDSSLLSSTNILVAVIILEALVIMFLGAYTLSFLNILRGKVEAEHSIDGVQTASKKEDTGFTFAKWWKKVNNFKDEGEEETIDTGHNYDGIRELNNVTPPWFKAAFAASIIFAIVYMWRYHVAHTAPLQVEEYQIAMQEAEKEKEEFLKTQSNKVDENTVAMLDDAGIASGKTLFEANCVACHGATGSSMPGGVGPNLTDDYWLHGGHIKDIFKTIKYGVPDKGMRSWQDQFSPTQIAQLASFVKSIAGKKLPGKEPQGEMFKEDGAAATTSAADSTKPKVDSAATKK